MRVQLQPGPHPGRTAFLRVAASLVLLTALTASCGKGDPDSDGSGASTPGATAGDAAAGDAAAGDLAGGAADSSRRPGTGSAPGETVVAERTGAELYAQHCALCHGITGDGEAQIELAIQPRNFAQGGFAFGDTREALYKTVTDGLPGNSLMISYKALLTDAERWRVVDHVRTLIPQRESVPAQDRKLAVGDRSQFVRGHFGPIREGLPMRPRGMLVGLPGDLSFEYRTDDVRLLGIRQGEFVDRTDWDGRGGSTLEPLGEVVRLIAGGDPAATFAAAGADLKARLRSTRSDGTAAVVRYSLHDANGEAVAEVSETLRPGALADRTSFHRQFAVSQSRSGDALTLRLDGDEAEFVRDATGVLDGPAWFVRRDGDNRFTCYLVDGPAGLTRAGAEGCRFELPAEASVSLDVFVVITDSWSEETLEAWKGVLGS